MNKAELVRTLKRGYEKLNKEIPEGFEFLNVNEIKDSFADFKEELKTMGFQPNKIINALKTNDNEYLTTIGFRSDSNGIDSDKPKFQKIESGNTGEFERSGRVNELVEPSGQSGTEGTEISESEKALNEPILDNDIQRHLSGYNSQGNFSSEPETEEPPQPKRRRTARKGKQPRVDIDGLITGYVLLFTTNLIMPQLTAFVFNSVSRKTKVNSKSIALSNEQMTELRPIADTAADYLQYKINPLVLFAVVMGVMYTGNVLTAIENK